MLDFLIHLFDSSGFPPRWTCGTWSVGHGWLHILSDVGVWSAYFVIPCVLAYYALRRRDVPFRGVFLLFVAFILMCGLTHLMEAVIFWWPAYRLAGVLKLLTAVISWVTVFALVRVTPQVMALRSPAELETEIAERRRVEGELRALHDQLEERVARRTGELEAAVSALKVENEERKRAERQLRESEARFSHLADAMPQIVWTARPDGRLDYHNRRWYEYTGLPKSVNWEDGWASVLHPDDAQKWHDAWSAAVRSGEPYQLEYRFKNSTTGRYRWHLRRVVPVRRDGEMIDWWVGTCTDIDDQKRTEEELKESERLYRAIGESIDYGVWVCDREGRNTFASPSFLKLVGITQEQCSDFGWTNALHPDEAEGTIAAWQECIRAHGRWNREHRFRGVDGQYHPVLVRSVPVEDERGNLLCWAGINLDISQLKQAEDELRTLNGTLEQRVAERTAALEANEALLRQFIRHSPAAIAMFDRNLCYLQMSDRWLIDYRMSGRDVIGRSHYEVFPDAPDHWKAVHERVLAGAVEKCDEEQFPRAGGPADWLQWECRPWLKAGNEVGGIIMYTQVITERKMIEEQVKASLREKEVLLKEIHHRVKNNMQIVSTLLDLQSGHTTDPEALEMFRESRGRVKSMALIHDRLYRSQDMALVNFAEYIRHLVDDLHRTYKVSGDVRLELVVDIPPLTIDIAIPCGLILNELISNCFKHAFARAAEGCLRVSLHRTGGTNVMTVADDGAGFPAGTDFRNTTSFGLQLVDTLVDQLDGEMDMTADNGTTFTVRFPKPTKSPPGTAP